MGAVGRDGRGTAAVTLLALPKLAMMPMLLRLGPFACRPSDAPSSTRPTPRARRGLRSRGFALLQGACAMAAGGNAFVYGTLMAPEVVSLLIKRAPPFKPATLAGYTRHKIRGQVFPAIVPSTPTAVVKGQV